MEDGDFDQRLRDLQREYLEFLDDEEDQGIYMEKVKQMISDKGKRLVVNINDLRRKSPERARNLLETAFEEQIAFQRALKEYVSSIDPTYAKEQEEFFVAFSGSFGTKHVTPRSLTSRYLGNLICVEGIVTRVSLVRPKVVRSVHYCPATKKVMERKYTDLTSFEAFPTSAVYPTKDDEGNPLETEYGLSRYKDHQTLTVQEMPEKAPAGQLPRSVDIVCDDDLVDQCKPGDRVQIVGNYRCLPSKQGSFTAGTFRTVLIANNITQVNREMNQGIILEDIKLCKRLAKSSNIFERMSKSLAPSIHGHDFIKQAIFDINILLIGDPSVAKSQLLRYVLMTAPRAITTTGRGSSGVGLTAAVTTDPETGDRRNPKEQDGEVLPMGSLVDMLSTENPDNDQVEDTQESIYEKYDPLLHGKTRKKKEQYFSTKFMKKYLHIAKLIKPKLSQEACDVIADEYAKLRNQDMMESDVARVLTREKRRKRRASSADEDENELTIFKSSLQQLYRDERANSLPLARITEYLNEKYAHEKFDSGEINAALNIMTKDNQSPGHDILGPSSTTLRALLELTEAPLAARFCGNVTWLSSSSNSLSDRRAAL
ncbi:unnamed protein product [Leptidea sinapis]|uniref:DNA replication licensing factor MCM3 n=1 Tax=Leptidea sinapis TaxID=189913 RepID=A0A5E4QQD1_9NEOP|nr:unnamed protein product [Leptidea sinapis]